VFLHCANQLSAAPVHCTVIEDSVNGVVAGKSAGMKVVVIPYPEDYNNPKFAIADHKLRDLNEFINLF
jgi:sugar-phosphatase